MAGLSERDLDEIGIRQLAASGDLLNPIAMRLVTEDVPTLLAKVRTLRTVLFRFVDGEDECSLDHHGNCQEHRLGNPCEVADARQLLGMEPATERDSERQSG